jgi:hypothetical protein
MANPTIIKPTVGRKVWCFASMAHFQAHQRGVHGAQPHDGTVIFVHDDRCINIRVMGHNGEQDIVRGLPLWQEGDPEPNGAHARWMPYQTKQQAKQDADKMEAAGGSASVGTTGETNLNPNFWNFGQAQTETQVIDASAKDPELLGRNENGAMEADQPKSMSESLSANSTDPEGKLPAFADSLGSKL